MNYQLLEIVEGADAGKRIQLDRRIVIGRGADADLTLADKQSSERHAIVTQEGDDTFLEDLGSTNGTFVNSQEVHDRIRIAAGAEILIGVTVIRLRNSDDVKRQP